MGAKNIGKLYPSLPNPRPCKDCGRMLDRICFRRPDRGKTCKECAEKRKVRWAMQNPDKVKVNSGRSNSKPERRTAMAAWASENRQKKRMIVLKHYSPKLICQRCGFEDVRALTVDHIAGGGCKHRKEVTGRSHGSLDFYKWIIKNNFPPMFQILCSNCQSIKRWENKEGVKIDFKER